MAAIRASVCIKRVNFDSVYCRAKKDNNQVDERYTSYRENNPYPYVNVASHIRLLDKKHDDQCQFYIDIVGLIRISLAFVCSKRFI